MAEKENRFKIKQKELSGMVRQIYTIVDKETGVNYLFVSDGSAGGLTPLLDAEGKPVITLPETKS